LNRAAEWEDLRRSVAVGLTFRIAGENTALSIALMSQYSNQIAAPVNPLGL